MSHSFAPPPRWTAEELERDIQAAIHAFRQERFEEPLEKYSSLFDEFLALHEDLLELTVDLTQVRDHAQTIAEDENLLHAFRFLAGPFMSIDDLKTIAATRLSKRALREDPDAALRIVEAVFDGLDRHRFPWVAEDRVPEEHERRAAVLASAALMATESTRTLRRNAAKEAQEDMVASALADAGLRQVKCPRHIENLEDAPRPGEFCRETKLGRSKADLIIGLWDRRRVPLECKVSNSAVNSYKRVNHEAAGKAETWLHDFGRSQVVPAAVLSGVFKRANLEDAQARGLTLIWAHRLEEMLDWIMRTRA